MDKFKEPASASNQNPILSGSEQRLLALFWNFLRRPLAFSGVSNSSFGKKFFSVFQIWSLTLLFLAPVFLALLFLSEFSGYDINSNNSLGEFWEQSPLWLFVFVALVWAPLSEESAFRLALRYSPGRLAAALAVIFYLALGFLQPSFGFWLEPLIPFFSGYGFLAFSILITMAVFCFLMLAIRKFNQDIIKRFYDRHFRWLVYGSAIFFGLAHLLNYGNLAQVWPWAYVLVLPQALIGLSLAFVRVYYGFFWSVYLHFLHNLLLSAPALFLHLLSLEAREALLDDAAAEIYQFSQVDIAALFVIPLFVLLVLVLVLFSLLRLFGRK